MIIIQKDAGLSDPFARCYYDSVDNRNRLSIRQERYAKAIAPPNYPMPARYHVSLDPDGLGTMGVLANIIFHAEHIFYLHDYDCVD